MTLSDVYAGLAYYYDHWSEIDEAIKKSNDFVNGMRGSRSQLKFPENSLEQIEKLILAQRR